VLAGFFGVCGVGHSESDAVFFCNYDVVLTVDDSVEFAITLFEKTGNHWHQINPEPLQFAGELGIPLQYQWSEGGLSPDVAISVSGQPHLE
jgi:hypothetical protein